MNANKGWSNVCTYNHRRKFYDCMGTRHEFSRNSALFWNLNGVFNCDIHAGYAELTLCIQRDRRNNGQLHMMTMLRNPIERHISEFNHVKRGAVWSKSVRYCVEEPIYANKCYLGRPDWSHVTWTEFLSCEYK